MIWLVNPGKRKRKAKSKKRRSVKRAGRVSFRRADGTTVSFGGGKFRKNPGKKHGNARRSAAVRRAALRNLAKARKALFAKKSKKRGKSSRKSTSVAKRATKKGPSMAKRKGKKKKTKAQRRAIALRNLAKARAGKKSSGKRKSRKGGKKSAARRGSKSKARRTHSIKAVHAAGARLAKYRWTGNPVSGIFGAVKSVAPLAASFYIGRFAASKVGSVPGIGPAVAKLGNHAGPVASIALLVAGHFATKKISGLQKYAGPIMQGFALNFINTAISTYAPETVRKAIGVGDAGIYDEALGMGEYVNQAGYETIDGYETVGDMQDMADYADLADAREALVPSRSTVEQIGPWSPEEATEASGMFAHNGWGGY
jgi:hypothetical protein